ncbi:MAG TPA: DUF2281 domain-containing protein [Tepidisphaeraceae bacterium]|nr:DUF2281 domain-containing protein [Tepidisphaeraceae bacterium]
MSVDTQELIRTIELLPEAKQVEVVDFARFLLSQQTDDRWEQIIADPSPRPRLDEFLKQSKAEGSTPLDPDQL